MRRGLNGSNPATRLAQVILAPALALGWVAHAEAATSCLNNNLEKLCLDLSSVPGDSVQPSGLGDTTNDTSVKYSAVFRNAGQSSTRHITLDFQLSTAAGFSSFTADPGLPCSMNGGAISCALDKFAALTSYTITAYALPPPYSGASTPATMTNTGTYGWNGNTQATTQSIAVSTAAGKSWIPANKTVTLMTAPEAQDPSQQVTPENPLWAKMTLPPRPTAYYAALSVTTSGPDSSSDCVGGLYVGNGTPYVCRDTATPKRWILTDLPDDSFTPESPVEFTMVWDASIVPSTQQPPNTLSQTGVPAFAIFHNQTQVGVPYGRTRAFANTCDAAAPVAPCVFSVAQLGSGDWTAHFLKPNDGSDMSDPLAPLARLLQFIVNSAQANPISLGPVIK